MQRFNLAKIDCKNLTSGVVEERAFKKNLKLYQLANKLFQMKTLHGAGSITILNSVDSKLVDLDSAMSIYQGLPTLNKRDAARQMPIAGN